MKNVWMLYVWLVVCAKLYCLSCFFCSLDYSYVLLYVCFACFVMIWLWWVFCSFCLFCLFVWFEKVEKRKNDKNLSQHYNTILHNKYETWEHLKIKPNHTYMDSTKPETSTYRIKQNEVNCKISFLLSTFSVSFETIVHINYILLSFY